MKTISWEWTKRKLKFLSAWLVIKEIIHLKVTFKGKSSINKNKAKNKSSQAKKKGPDLSQQPLSFFIQLFPPPSVIKIDGEVAFMLRFLIPTFNGLGVLVTDVLTFQIIINGWIGNPQSLLIRQLGPVIL